MGLLISQSEHIIHKVCPHRDESSTLKSMTTTTKHGNDIMNVVKLLYLIGDTFIHIDLMGDNDIAGFPHYLTPHSHETLTRGFFPNLNGI